MSRSFRQLLLDVIPIFHHYPLTVEIEESEERGGERHSITGERTGTVLTNCETIVTQVVLVRGR